MQHRHNVLCLTHVRDTDTTMKHVLHSIGVYV